MKVLQLIDTLDAGGAERMAVNIGNALLDSGISSYVCATRRGGPLENEIDNSVDFFVLGKKGKLDITAFRRFFKWVKEKQIDIIHAHSTSILLAVLAKINNRKLKIVWHDHYGLSDAIDQRPTRVLKILATYIDATIAVNETLADWSTEILKIKNVLFVPNFANLSEKSDKITLLKGVDSKRVICLANLRLQKNHLVLMSAFKESIIQYPEWTLHLVGKSFNDDYSRSIEQYIIENDLSSSVFLYGSREDVSSILKQATIGVLASISEGLPVSLLEYGNSGLPVIVTNVGQCAKVIGDNGLIIDDVETQLPAALVRLYKNQDNELDLLGSRFRESIIKTYSKEAFMQKVLPIYKALIS